MFINYDSINEKLDSFLKDMALRALKENHVDNESNNHIFNGFNVDWDLMISKARSSREKTKNINS